MNLYELTENFLAVQTSIEEGNTDLIDTLEAIEGAIEVKAQGIIAVTRNITSQIEAIKAEEKRLADMRKVRENHLKRLKEYVLENMQQTGKTNIKTELGVMRIQASTPALKITNQEKIPAEYQTIVPEHYEIDNERVKEALKDGKAVPGAELVQGVHLRIA